MRREALVIMAAATLAAATTAPGPARAAEPYRVGVSAAMTGRGSGGYAPVVEAMKLYIERLNAAGGIHGHPVRLMVRDNQAQPAKGAADAKRFVNQEGVHLLVNSSLSSTYAPMIAAARRGRVALLFAGSVCPKEVYPPADPLLACSTAYAANLDGRFAIDFIRAEAAGPVRLGVVSMAIPISRAEVDGAAAYARGLGVEVVANEAVPPPTPDYSPFATKLIGAGADWVYSWAPWVTQVKTFQALRKQGWKGRFVAYAHLNAEEELKRIRDPGLIVYGANALFQDDLPIHREIREAHARSGAKYPATFLAEGWIAGMTIEGILRNVPWPASRDKVVAALGKVNVDLQGLRGGPLTWSEDNHFRLRHYYRVYRWDEAKGAIVRVRDWTGVDVK